jgi:hypothetical protein
MRPFVRRAAAVVVAACWLAAGAEPLVDAARGARDPVDFARDYVAARARLEDGRGPAPDGDAANARAVRLGAPPAVLLGAIYYIHPPPAVLPVLPLAALPWRGAALAWLAASLLALGWLAHSLLALAARGQPPAPARVALATAALALWPPVLHGLEKGQWSILIAALLAAGLRALEGERPRRAGVLFGLAAALKVTPLVLAVVLVLRHRRAAAAMLATFAAAVAATVAVSGVGPWRAFLGGAARNAAVWAPWIANTASPAGVYARLFAGGPFARPLFEAPALANAAFDLTAAALIVAALLGLRAVARARPSPAGAAGGGEAAGETAILAAWLTFPVLLNPLGWTHVVVMLLAPLVIAVRDGGPRTRRVAFFVLAALTVPREALARFAGPIPVAPIRGLALGLHAAAAVALFATLLRVARDGAAGGERA